MALPLSEAVLLGSLLKPQAFGAWRSDIDRVFFFSFGGQQHLGGLHGATRTCAMGAALDAVGALDPPEYELYMQRLADHFPIALKVVAHPLRPRCVGPLMTIAMTLNDEDEWSRERIADWIAGIELAQERIQQQDVPPFLRVGVAVSKD